MYEIIVRVMRVVASMPRLRILSYLVRTGETPPTVLARELGISLDLVSAHLRRLVAVGLIQRRRSGAWSFCVAQSPYGEGTLSNSVTSWLRKTLRNPRRSLKHSGVGQVRNATPESLDDQLHALVFEAATAFTDVRRLQILHRLSQGDAVLLRTIKEELRMSGPALHRHMDKLSRRGYVEPSAAGRSLTYRLASEFRTPLHGRLLEIVQSCWQGE